MSESTSNIKAAKFRDEGNAFYRQNKFFKAVESYNKSLCFAETNEVKSLAFANRSAVYLETKKYQLCLENIQLARLHGYPGDKLSKLNEREVKCNELKKHHKPDPRENPWNFFKLSYPANKKLPFIVDCLELKENEKFGRHIVTNRGLKPGDIIAIEDPWFKYLDPDHCYERCSNCLKANDHSLIPCQGRCTDTMYCSEDCAKSAEPCHREYECGKRIDAYSALSQKLLIESLITTGGIKELEAFMETKEKLTIFDIDMTNPEDPQTKKKLLKAFLNLMPVPETFEDQEDYQMKRQCIRDSLRHLWSTNKGYESLFSTIDRLMKIFIHNTGSFASYRLSNHEKLDIERFGSLLTLFGAFLNHSCDSNARWSCVDNKLVTIVKHPIKAGEQLFVNYTGLSIKVRREERRELLLKNEGFFCECNACENFSDAFSNRTIDKRFKMPESLTSFNPISDFKKNCNYIQKNFKNHPCIELSQTHFLNLTILAQIENFGSLRNFNH